MNFLREAAIDAIRTEDRAAKTLDEFLDWLDANAPRIDNVADIKAWDSPTEAIVAVLREDT